MRSLWLLAFLFVFVGCKEERKKGDYSGLSTASNAGVKLVASDQWASGGEAYLENQNRFAVTVRCVRRNTSGENTVWVKQIPAETRFEFKSDYDPAYYIEQNGELIGFIRREDLK